MSELRWILVAAGGVLVLAIYLWDKRTRRGVGSDLATSRNAPRKSASSSASSHREPPVPELDEVVGTARVLETSSSMRASEDFNSDSLPSMRAFATAEESHTPTMGDMRSDWSVGASGDRKIEPSLSESVLASANFTRTGTQRAHPQMSAHVIAEEGSVDSPSTYDLARATVDVQSNVEQVTTSRVQPEPRPQRKITSSRKIIALRLTSGATKIDGGKLKSLLEAANLQHGKYSIYHRLHDADSALFSVASMVEPGTFDPFSMSGMQFPGVTLFAQLPGPIDGMEIFSQLLSCARQLEEAMSGQLQDERGLPLTEQRAARLHEDIADFLHLLGTH